MQRSSVDLPEPLGPITQVTVPRFTSRSTPRRTSRLPNRFWMPSSLRIEPPSLTASPGSAVVWLGHGQCLAAHPRRPPSRSERGLAAAPRRSSTAALRLCLLARDQPVDQPGERDRDEQEQDRAERQRGPVDVERLVVEAGLDHLDQAEEAHERGVLHQRDEVVQERRDHLADGLGDDDGPHRLAVAHAQRARRLHLTARHRLDPGPVDLRHVGAVGDGQGDDPVPERDGCPSHSGTPIDRGIISPPTGEAAELRNPETSRSTSRSGMPRKTSM